MIGKKTAALLGASAQAGAILATDDQETIDAFQRFGYDMGLAFQMADDVKGTFWSAEESGKASAGDVRKRKKTLPVVWAFENATDEDQERLRRIYAPRIRATDGAFAPDVDPLLGDAQVAEVIAILERSGARTYAESEARRCRDSALATVAAHRSGAPRGAGVPHRDLHHSLITERRWEHGGPRFTLRMTWSSTSDPNLPGTVAGTPPGTASGVISRESVGCTTRRDINRDWCGGPGGSRFGYRSRSAPRWACRGAHARVPRHGQTPRPRRPGGRRSPPPGAGARRSP